MGKRGISLLEIMVVVMLFSTLVAIAIPTYNKHVRKTRSLALQTDISSLHKGWQAFGASSRNYCFNELSRVHANIVSVGLRSLLTNGRYGSEGKRRPNFIGFGVPFTSTCKVGGQDSTGAHVAGVVVKDDADNMDNKGIGVGIDSAGTSSMIPTYCGVDNRSYAMGGLNFVGGKFFEAVAINEEGILERLESDQVSRFLSELNCICQKAQGDPSASC